MKFGAFLNFRSEDLYDFQVDQEVDPKLREGFKRLTLWHYGLFLSNIFKSIPLKKNDPFAPK